MIIAWRQPAFWRESDPTGVPRGVGLHPTVRDIVFAHIPKTAGTSIRNMLVAARPDAVKIFDYGANTSTITGDFVNAYTSDAGTPEGLLALRSQFGRKQRLLVSGHIVASRYLAAFHPASFVTFLRNPIDRIVSAYKHHVRHAQFKGSFSDFYEQPSQINVQSRMLWGIDLDAIGFVGLTEHMPDMLTALARHLNADLKIRKENVSSRLGAPRIDDGVRARIMALNDEDVQLYRHVEANLDYFTNYRGRKVTGLDFARGKVARRGDGMFRGWALTFHPSRLAEIEVKVGGQVIHRYYADQFVASMRNRALHGVGGFSVQLPPPALAGQTQVRFVIAGTEKDLDGSPITL